MPLQLKLAAELEENPAAYRLKQNKSVVVRLGHEDRVWQVSWDPSGLRLASCSGDKSVRVWAPLMQSRFFTDEHQNEMGRTWECVDTIDAAHKRTVRSVAFEPTRGRTLATASFDGTTGIWEKEEDGGVFECIATLEGHENETKSVSWSPSGHLLATCGRDRSVWIWESSGEGDFDCVSVLMEHTNDVKMVTWHPKDDLLASFSYDDSIRLWREDDDDWYSAATLTGHTSTVWAGAFSPDDGRFLASVSDDRTVRIWAAPAAAAAQSDAVRDGFYHKPDTTYECIAVVPDSVHTRAIYSVAWTRPLSDGGSEQLGFLATGCGDNTMRILRVTAADDGSLSGGINVALECSYQHAHALSDINCVQWNPVYPTWLATAGDDGVVRIWHLE
ncbi:Cytosolic iron-sulfur protein assembly protein [Coemansia sp. RSA 1933]|nr:Cytosolic iron-sulfur protein assembly protein [Coemansia sp. RSA 1933]